MHKKLRFYLHEWTSVKDKPPPPWTELLVLKYYLDHEFDMENGGYDINKPINLGPYIQMDRWCNGWEKGGWITHWIELPKLPKLPKDPYKLSYLQFQVKTGIGDE